MLIAMKTPELTCEHCTTPYADFQGVFDTIHKKRWLCQRCVDAGILFVVKKPPITTLAHELIHGEKRDTYGEYNTEVVNVAAGWSAITGSVIQPRHVPLMMAWLKIIRESYQHKRDNLIDLCGYAELADELVNAFPQQPSPNP